MATDIIARGMAANAKKSVTELGDKVESEKWIGTKAEWEAVDKSTIKDGTIVYITDDKTVILYDKAEMEKIAAKVAEDRTAAETAAQTAQSIADSLPEDYTTAVEKIAENTAEIGRVKLTDKELQRRVNALYSIGQGITHRFETDSSTAYAKTIPTGGKLMSVKNVGGRSIVFNQLVDSNIVIGETTRYSFNGQHLTTNITDSLSLSDDLCTLPTIPVGHKVLLKIRFIAGNVGNKEVTIGGYHKTANISWQCRIDLPRNTELAGKTLCTLDTTTDTAESIRFFLYNAIIPLLTNIDCYINYYDLTAMFGTGNEPTTVEEFEKIFPADYYPYNAGEIVSAGTEEIVEQGKNLFDKSGKENSDAYTIPMYYNGRYKGLKIPCENGDYTVSTKHKSGYVSGMSKSVYVFDSEIRTDNNITGLIIEHLTGYGYNVDKTGIISVKHGYIILSVFSGESTGTDRKSFFDLCDIQIEKSPTATAYAPYHSNVYQIPEAIKALPGYGWSAGTARNYVDYENKRYVQCVQSVDLGTLEWLLDGNNWWYNTKIPKGLSDSNAICNKRTYVLKGDTGNETQWCHSGGGYFEVYVTDVTTSADVSKKLSGVILYYELATPIVTDISSLIPDDFLRNMEVEAGGSITFKGGNDDYRIPVPNEEEYVVKLSEVGGTT